jgi:hypothetical protein
MGPCGILSSLERKEIINRDSVSYIALIFLTFGCCRAGVHFDWLLINVGVVLTVMTETLATLKQYTVLAWSVMILATDRNSNAGLRPEVAGACTMMS